MLSLLANQACTAGRVLAVSDSTGEMMPTMLEAGVIPKLRQTKPNINDWPYSDQPTVIIAAEVMMTSLGK